MPLLQRFADFLHDLQQLEKASGPAHGTLILDAFTRHTPFDLGAVYLREGRDSPLKLAAKSLQFVAPEIVDSEDDGLFLQPMAQLVVPLRSHRDRVGVLALSRVDSLAPSDEDLALVRAGAVFVSTLITNQRLMQETREGDFQLKYRLWELESLYDIGLSISSTLNIEELADEILFRLISLTNARRAALFLRENDRFSLYRSFGEVRGEFLDEELSRTLLAEGQPIIFGEGTDYVFPGCSAFVAVPIKGRNDEIFGVLAAADRETREGGIGAFEPNELRLLSLFASQAAIGLENARLHKQALEKQEMERELELAATIQRDILPKAIPAVAGLEISTLSRPARRVGGDYHAFFDREGVLSLLVADVSGKSMPAALLVSALHAAVQLLFAEGRNLGDIATELNRHIHNWSAENKFITLVMVSIDRENDTIQYVNAGHNPAYVIVDGQLETMKAHGLPIGMLAKSTYAAQTLPFPPGSAVFLYSDGINEAENVGGEEFEYERLEHLLTTHISDPPKVIRDAIVSAVDAFTGEAPQKDDQTLVIARRV